MRYALMDTYSSSDALCATGHNRCVQMFKRSNVCLFFINNKRGVKS